VSEPREQQEPSMEEILSSIRRIIADEEAEEGRTEERAEASEAEYEEDETGADDDEEDVLELTQVVREGGEVVDLNTTEEPASEETSAPAAAAEAEPEQPEPEAMAEPGAEPEELEFVPQPEAPGAAPEEQTASQEEPSAVSTKQAIADELLSDTAASAATGAFAKLSSAVQRTAPEESVAEDSGRTVEQFVEDMIRPMLKSWLDENLPPIVERLVEKEIQKIARRAELL